MARQIADVAAPILASLAERDGPLAGLTITLSHVVHDWGNAPALADLLGRQAADSMVVGSPEGGLFEDGDDEVVALNLAVQRRSIPADFAMVGSLARDDSLHWLWKGAGSPGLRPPGPAAFGALAGRAGWVIRQAASSPLYHVVALTKGTRDSGAPNWALRMAGSSV